MHFMQNANDEGQRVHIMNTNCPGFILWLENTENCLKKQATNNEHWTKNLYMRC